MGVRFATESIYLFGIGGEPEQPNFLGKKKFSLPKDKKWTENLGEAIGYIRAFQEQHQVSCGGIVSMHHGTGAGGAKTLNDSIMSQLRLEGATYYFFSGEFNGRLVAGNRQAICKIFGCTAPQEFLSTTAKEFRGISNWGKLGVEFKEAGAAAVAGLVSALAR